MVTSSEKFTRDWFERVGATAGEIFIGLLIVEFADLNVWWAAPIGVALAAAKSWLAKYVAKKNTASLAPGV